MNKKFVPHDNLSDVINLNIMQSEKDGGEWLKNVKIGQTIAVQTKNTLYRIQKVGNDNYLISGHAKYCPTFIKCNIAGSTWGGSMLKMKFIGIGMCLEFYINYKRITTSEIIKVEVL